MATYDHYATPVPPGTWDVPAAGATCFSWEYDDGRSRLLDLYQRGKDKQRDAAKRIDWDICEGVALAAFGVHRDLSNNALAPARARSRRPSPRAPRASTLRRGDPLPGRLARSIQP